jgi:hypothetical protein
MKELNPDFFYNENLESYKLELYYIGEKSDYKKTALIIKKMLSKK